MEIELRQLKYNEQQSKESIAFTANLYINDKKVGIVSNDGWGGPTDYNAITTDNLDIIQEAEEYCSQLPKREIEIGGQKYSVPTNLSHYLSCIVYDQVNDDLRKKHNLKLERKMTKGLNFGIPDKSFTTIPLDTPVASLLASKDGKEKLAAFIKAEILPELKGEVRFLNTNIPEDVLHMAELKPGQYQLPKIKQGQQIKKSSTIKR